MPNVQVMALFTAFCCAVCLPGVEGEAQLIIFQVNKASWQKIPDPASKRERERERERERVRESVLWVKVPK
jgi:hypothetical protein